MVGRVPVCCLLIIVFIADGRLGHEEQLVSLPPRCSAPQPKGLPWVVHHQACGRTCDAQGFGFTNNKTLELISAKSNDTKFCVVDTSGAQLAVHITPCDGSSLSQQWTKVQVPRGFQIKNDASGRCLRVKKGEDGLVSAGGRRRHGPLNPIHSGVCDSDAVWWEDVLAMPLGMLRTVGHLATKPAATQEQCMGTPLAAMPWAPQPESVCRFVMKLLPTVNITKFPVIKTAGATITMHGLSIFLGGSAEKFEFDVCNFMTDVKPEGATGNLRLTMTLPQVNFHLSMWHFVLAAFHGTGDATGYVRTHIEVPFAYDLGKPSLQCQDFEMTVPDVGLALHGGGFWHGIVELLTGTIKKQVQQQVPALAKKEVCPLINKLLDAHFNQCFAPGKSWAAILVCCILGKPPSLSNISQPVEVAIERELESIVV